MCFHKYTLHVHIDRWRDGVINRWRDADAFGGVMQIPGQMPSARV
jgi:hypothetical protein